MFKGGANVPHFKKTENCETVVMKVPEKVVIPMLQHIGAPCEPYVQKGDEVKVGQVIGNTDKFVSAPLHSSVSGVVTDVSPKLYAGGVYVTSIEIKTDGNQEVDKTITPPKYSSSEEFIGAIRKSGLVGLDRKSVV